MNRTKSSIPFVGLHAHSTAGSPFDAIGYPQQHMDFAYQNGCDALALTDHGNCNGIAYQVLHAKSMEKEGKEFKAHEASIYAVTFHGDGKSRATASSDKTVKFWNWQEGKETGKLTGHTDAVWAVTFSPDGVSKIFSEKSDITAGAKGL